MENKQLNVNDLDDCDKNRKSFSFRFAKTIIRIISRKPRFKYACPLPDEPILLLSNHVGKQAPSKLVLYYPRDFRMWGTHEMTEGLKAEHKYLRTTYYHEKKHLPKWLANIVATIVAPFVNAFHKGMGMIPTYTDQRFMTTLKRSAQAYVKGRDIVVFPEDSSKGYKDRIEKFFCGFVSLLKLLSRKGYDVPIVVTYFNRKDNTFYFSEKFTFGELTEKYGTDEEIAEALRNVMNSLAVI